MLPNIWAPSTAHASSLVHPPPRKRRGGPIERATCPPKREGGSERRWWKGAQAMTKPLRRKRSVEAGPPPPHFFSTWCAPPPPPAPGGEKKKTSPPALRAGADNKTAFSRRVFCARGLPSHCTKALPRNKKGGRSADRRLTHYQPRHTDKRYRLPMLRARRAPRIDDVTVAMRFGRARLSALHRGFPRAALGCTRFGPGRASRE